MHPQSTPEPLHLDLSQILTTPRLPAGFPLPPTVLMAPVPEEGEQGPEHPTYEDAAALFEGEFLPHIKPMSER